MVCVIVKRRAPHLAVVAAAGLAIAAVYRLRKPESVVQPFLGTWLKTRETTKYCERVRNIQPKQLDEMFGEYRVRLFAHRGDLEVIQTKPCI